MKKPDNPKERGLIKGAMRRVFSRSDLRRQAIEKNLISHKDPNRPRATAWVFCSECGLIFPRYLAEVDHVAPVIPYDKTLETMTWDEVADRIWCEIDNLACMCKDCHKVKTKAENKLRRELKKKGNK